MEESERFEDHKIPFIAKEASKYMGSNYHPKPMNPVKKHQNSKAVHIDSPTISNFQILVDRSKIHET
eukprot:scaffold238872_cov29-Prasinocladus_malaysianus.AAC.2